MDTRLLTDRLICVSLCFFVDRSHDLEEIDGFVAHCSQRLKPEPIDERRAKFLEDTHRIRRIPTPISLD